MKLYSLMENGSDNFGVGSIAWITMEISDWKVTVYGYDKDDTLRDNVSIGTSVTAIYILEGESITEW